MKRIERLRGFLRDTGAFEVDVAGNRVQLLHDGEQCFPAMFEAIGHARDEILLEMYWFDSDRTGRAFASALSAKAREGVRVRVIYDAVGSFGVDESMFAEMRAAGCEVIEYNPVAPFRKRFRLGVLNNRDHRKILVVDGRLAMTGGINLADHWAPARDGGDGWRDDMISIEGPSVEQMRTLFFHTWKAAGGSMDGARLTRDSREPRAPGAIHVRILANNYRGERSAIRKAYIARIVAAKKSVFIANSYFVPDRIVRLALEAAARRGVDVRVLLPGVSDVPLVRLASQRLFTQLLESGVRLFEWERTILHTKTAVVDEEWCTVGTFNLDQRSWRFNLEVNVSVEDPALGIALRGRIGRDMDASKEITLEHWRFRPFLQRIAEQFFYLFRRFL